ncbi:hypothetical protein NQ317_005007 [Molorchus minor]|uniref:Nucleoporin Ndc1 n=1 Tax=Molorchus minor TaxID=1323400 RepID=A0ABQ9K5C3_9CUCU|nr:hypothetical protein NQ317_005007 [Molorchus minor]
MTYECKGKNVCLNGGTFFLVISGVWSGLYYFIKVYISEKHLSFPVIYQRKFLQLKAQVLPLLKECFGLSLWPTIYFAVLYHYIGESLSKDFSSTFGYFTEDSPVCILIYLHLWMFGAIYYFNMHLMRFFFNLFLTEPIEFPLFKTNQDSLCLQESVNMSNLPIVQSLACLDLRNLAQWSKHRRQVLFTLSQPGGHPHNWNCLAENILKLLNEYTELLNKSMDVTELTKPIVAPIATQNPLRYLERFRNLRNMTLMTDSGVVDFVEVTQESSPIASFPQAAMEKLKQKLQSIFNFIKIVSGVNFLFGDLPQANVQKCLANGHVIIWTSQGLSDLVCASIAEDPYGVVQKDLPAIITSLVRLRQCLDKLNKVPALTKRVVGFDDFNYRMKSAVSAAVKRSLFNICRTFGGYMNEVPLSKEVITYLQTIYNKV